MNRMMRRESDGRQVWRFWAAGLALLIGSWEARAATGLLTNVPEAAGYTLVYELPIPLATSGWGSNPVPYSYTNTASIANGSFDRVAYYMELVKASGQTQWVYVSMTAFTTNATRLGIPRNYVLRNGLYDTAAPSNATIRSNVSGITNTNGCNTVNLEFWPSNYGGQNDYGIPGANGSTYDFGDGGASTSSGHSSMQIHNYGAGQTLFAYNAWAGTGTSNLGLGNCPTPVNGGVDWTFDTSNISTYTVRTLQILVRTLGVVNLPATNVTASSGWINGQLSIGNACDVYAYWGSTDQGTNSGLWANSALLGTYSNGTFDLTRQVTGLAGGATTWYTFLASNATATAWGQPSLQFVTATTPTVNNGAGASTSVGQAVLRGNLIAGGTADVYIYWGLTDGGQTAGYANTVKLTDVPQGAFSTTVAALSGFPYYYICCASNEAGVAWAPASSSFALPTVSDGVSYSLGLRGSMFQPVAFSQSAVDLRGAAYTVSPSRVFTGTLPGTVLATAEMPSKNIVLTGPATTWNEFGGSPGDNFVAALSGRFFPPVTGTYTFRWSQDDRGWMFLDAGDDGVFDSSDAVGIYAWDGIGSRTLTAGQGYNFILFSQESAGGDSLNFWYTPPAGVETFVNPAAQSGQWTYASASVPSASMVAIPLNPGSLSADAATLKGDLTGKGWGFDVYAFWGPANGGNVAANWQTNAFVGRFDDWDGPVSLAISGLATNELYYYTFFISNALKTAWASNVETFATDAVTIEAADASASEAGPDTGRFRVTRPVTSTNGALTVFYSLGGTALNGADYATLSGSVVIPDGDVSADFVVTPIDDTVWQEGGETVVATLAAGNYLIGAANSAVVTIQDGDAAPSAWSQRMPLRFTGYNRAEALTNFPALVILDTGLAGFSYDQFLSGANGDLRFTDGTMTRELPYEIESWNPGGQSRVWVQVPVLTNNAAIWMLWRRAGVTAPAYTANGATWSESYVNVAHLSESAGTVGNSATVASPVVVSGAPVQGAPGVIGAGVQFDGLDDLINFGTVGRPYDNFTFSAWIKTPLGHERETQSSSGTGGTAGQRYAFDVEQGGSSSAGSGLSVGTNGLSVYEHAGSYMPSLAVYSNMIGSGWNFVTVTYLNRQPRIYCNGALVCTGVASPRSPVYAPYRFGGQINGYGYLEGSMDEVRVASVTRSANWIWAEYMNAASNDVFATAGDLQSGDSPLVENRPASAVAATSATLNGYLSATGATATAVAVYWGEQDGGTDAGAWANTNGFAAPAATGAFSANLSGLTPGTVYFFRFAATNASGAVWAATTETLLTAAVTLQAADATAAEEPADTGAVTVSRGAAYAAPLTVYYTLSGTGVNGVDYSSLGGSVTIPAGAASATVTVSPLFNRNYLVRATDTVTLTLASGGYIAGSPDSGTVTITNWQPTSAVGVDVPRNFYSATTAPLTGSETLVKTSAGQMMFGASSGNTFNGDIKVETDGGILRVGGVNGAASGLGVTLPNMTAANTVTIKRGGQLYIDDNGTGGSSGSTPNRFGTEGNRPAVALAGGTLTLNGANNNNTVPQNLGTLNLGAGYSTLSATRNFAGTPELVFSELNRTNGSHVNFTSTANGTAVGLGASALNAMHIRFVNEPAMIGAGGAAGTKTMSILPGARYGSDWVTHHPVSGVRPLAAAEYNTVANNDVNTAGATENVRITGTTPTVFPPLSADKTVNSLNINVNASVSWNPTNKLTLTSGQLISGVQNQQVVVQYPSTLTAGSGSDASLDVSVFQNNTYIRSLITDNGSGKVTLTKNGGATLILDGSVDNTYSGGTYVNEGVLTTGGTANRRFLGTGPVRVDAAQLTLGQVGATANASGPDYTAVNGGQIGVTTAAYTSDDTFSIESGSVIYGGASLGLGLNSLDRGGATPNITLGSDAIVAHSTQLTAPLSLGTNTIKNLGTSADLYYGLVSDQSSPAGAITVGSNTPFKGLSTDRYDRRWGAGLINAAPGTSEIWLQGMIRPGSSPANLYIGNWLIDGGPVIASSDAGPLTANVLGTVILSDSFSTFGDISAGKPLTFAVKAGSTLAVDRPDAMGIGNGLASVRVEDGGTMTTWTPAGINGAVTVQAGGRFQANNAGGLTSSGAVTFESGSILELSTALGFTGPQADAIAAALPPGQLVRLNVDPFGSSTEMLDARLGAKAPIYEVYGGDRRQVNPQVTNTTVMTLNRDAATGKGGMLINDWASRSLASAANGVLVIGPNGGTIAATSNTTLYVTQRMALGANALTIGATDVLDRVLLPKLGTVQFNSAFGLNTALPGSSITVIPGATLNNAANTLPDETHVTVNGTLLVGGTETIGSLSGSGLVHLQSSALTVGRNNTSSTFSGMLTNSVVSALFTKTGSGRLDITSFGHPYTGLFAANNGILALSGNGALSTPAGSATFTLSDGGTLLLDNSGVNSNDRLADASGVTFQQGGTFRFVGKDGEASRETLGAAMFLGGEGTIDVVNGTGSGSSAEVTFDAALPAGGTVNFTASNGTLGAAGDNPRVYFKNLAEGLFGYATVGGAPAYYDAATGVRAFTLGEGTEFDGTADQTGLDTTYTALNNHLALTAPRSVNSLWIDNPGVGYAINLGSSGANHLSLASGRLSLTGNNDFTLTRSGSSSGTLTCSANGTLFLGVGAGRTLTMGVPIANGAGVVEKDGEGTLVLSAGNTSTGTFNVNEGTVRYAAGGGGDLAASTVNILNNGVLDFAGDSDTLATLNLYSGLVTNSAANGSLTVTALTLGGGPFGTAATVDTGTGTGSLKLGGGNVTFSSVNDPNTATLAGRLDLNGGTRTFTVNNSYAPGAAVDLDIPAIISGGAGYGVTKSGGGVLRLRGANTFDGNIYSADNCGTIIAGHPQALGAPTLGRIITVNNNDTLVLDGTNGNIVTPSNYTNLFLNGGGDSQIGPVRGAIISQSGSNTVACPVILTGNAVSLASLQAGGTLALSGNISGAFDLTVNGDGDMVLGGAINTGTRSLTKNGTGMLMLSGTGTNILNAISVNAGKLVLAKANGTTGVNAFTGAVTVANGAVVQYAAASTNPDLMGNTGAITLNGNGQLDFNGASDTLGAVTISASGATGETTNIVNSAGGGNLTVSSLTVNVAPGLLTRMTSGTGALTLGGNVTFNASATGRAQLSGNLALGGATRTLTINTGIHTNDDMIIDAVISGGAGFGLTKANGGNLRLSGANTFDGPLTINSSGGSVIVGHPQALGTPSVARTATVNTGSTLALDGVGIYDPLNRIALNLNGTGNSRHGSVSGALVNLAGSNTVPCAITLAGATQIAAKQGKLTLTGAFSGGQALTVAGPGETALSGTGGTILSASSITVTSNGVFTLENSALTNSANRLGTMSFTLANGTLRFRHDGGAANFSEACGALTIGVGSNTVYASQAAVSQTSALTFTSLTCAGGTVNFVGDGLGDSAQNRIFITGQADGLIGPWATVNGTSLAMYSSSRGVYAGTGAEVGVAALGGDVASVIPNNDTVSAVINTMGSEGPITLAALWTNRVLEVRQETAYASIVAMTNDTATKALQTSRLAIMSGKEALTIGQSENSGALMALSSGGILTLENQNAAKTLTVNAAVPNNNAASGLSKFGPGPVVLTGSNSYSGATLINEGSLEFGGALAQRLDGVISGAGTLVKSGTNQLHLFGANTYTGPTYINAGIVRPDKNGAFGSTASGTYIASGAMLDVGSDLAVGGTRLNDSLNLGAEEFTVSGAGVGGMGVIVNNGTSNQMSAVQRVLLADDATFGGTRRWDIRSGYIFLNDHTLTKTGASEIALVSVPLYPGSGHVVVNQGLLRFESSLFVNGTAANTVTVNSGAKLELYLLSPFAPMWSLILNEGAFFQGSGNNSPSTNLNVWAGPVALNGRAFFNGNASPAHWTVSGEISGPGTLVKAGNGGATLWLTGTNNTYAGETIISNGVLYAKYPASLPGYNDGRLTVAGGGTLAVNSSDGTFGFTAAQIRDLNVASSFLANNAYLSIDTSFASLECPHDLPKRMGVIKQGTNTLTLSGNAVLGNTVINNGTLNLSGNNTVSGTLAVASGRAHVTATNAFAGTAEVYVGNSSLTNGVLTLGSDASLTLGGNFRVGLDNSSGAFYMNGGTLVSTAAAGDANFAFGRQTNSYGYFRMTGGSVTAKRLQTGGNGDNISSGRGLIRISEGSLNFSEHVLLGRNVRCESVLTLDGGSITHTNGNELSLARQGGRSELNISGGTFNNAGMNTIFQPTTGFGVGTGIVNLCAGALITAPLQNPNSSPATLNFSGGTLAPSADSTVFVPGNMAGVYSFGGFGSFAGGAVIDSNGKNVTIPASIQSPAGMGVVAIAVANAGSGYIGEPYVSIEGGSGTGATAVANMVDDGTGRGTFRVDSVTVTCPGVNYATPPTVLFKSGGFNIVTAQAGAVTLAANTSGGLTKIGAGTLTLSGTNTYSGATVISNGVLKLAHPLALLPNTEIVVAGGVLDLNGFTVTNKLTVIGGTISNGTIYTEFSPAGTNVVGTETLTLGNASIRGKYLADVTAGGASDMLNLLGTVNLTGLEVQIVDPEQLNRRKVYTIMYAPQRTGSLTVTNLNNSRWHVVYKADGNIVLVFVDGTVLFLK